MNRNHVRARRYCRKLILMVCCEVLFLVLHASGAAATEKNDGDERDIYRMRPVVVTATRLDTPLEDISANVTVITREEIERLPADSVAELLQSVPGVHIEIFGGPGSYAADIHMQGSETRQVAVYQDGVPLNELDNPGTDLSYLPLDAIDRIEVYKGAASAAWGSALGGIVNIVTRTPDSAKPFTADIHASYGEFDTLKTRSNFNGTRGRFGYLVSVAHKKSDGYIDNTEYEENSVYAKFHYNTGETGRLSFAYFYDKGGNADPVIPFPDFWDDIDRERTYQRVLFETELAPGWSASVEGRHHRWKIHIDDVFEDMRAVYNDYEDETWGGSGRLTYQKTPDHTFNIGFDGNSGEYDYIGFDRIYTTDAWALYANDTLKMSNWVFNAGLRYDNDSTFGDAASPVLGTVVHLWNGKALIRFQAARGFSAPPAAWVQDPNHGNPDLDSETALNYQLGGEVTLGRLFKFHWSVFKADIDDLIRFSYDSRRYENIDKVVRRGVEGGITAILPGGLTLSFSGSYADVRNDLTDDIIKDIPRTLYTVQANHTFRNFTHTLTGTYTDYNSSFSETSDKKFIFNYKFNLDLPFGNDYGNPGLYCAVYNIGDTHYLYRAVWPKPRRWVEAGVRFRF